MEKLNYRQSVISWEVWAPWQWGCSWQLADDLQPCSQNCKSASQHSDAEHRTFHHIWGGGRKIWLKQKARRFSQKDKNNRLQIIGVNMKFSVYRPIYKVFGAIKIIPSVWFSIIKITCMNTWLPGPSSCHTACSGFAFDSAFPGEQTYNHTARKKWILIFTTL